MHLLTGFVTVTSNEFFFSMSVFENSFPAFSAVRISVASKTDMSPIADITIYEKAEVNFQTRSSYFIVILVVPERSNHYFIIAKKETDPQVTVSPLLTAIPCAIREMVKTLPDTRHIVLYSYEITPWKRKRRL